MNNSLSTFLRFLFMAFFVMACTKQVRLVTEVEFEIAVRSEPSGFLNEAIPTDLTVIPEAELEGYSYSFSYEVLSGEGYFLNADGDQLPSGKNTAFESLTTSLVYEGTAIGEHVVKIVVSDIFGFTEETELTYEINNVPIVWTASADVAQAEPGDEVAVTLILENGSATADVTFESKFTLVSGSGTLTGEADATTGTSEDFSAIGPDTYALVFTPDALGTAELIFDLKDSNDQEMQAIITIEVVEEVLDMDAPEISLLGDNPQQLLLDSDYVELGAEASDTNDGDLTDQIVIDASEVDTSKEGSYDVRYTVTNVAGNTISVIRKVLVSSDNSTIAVTAVSVLPQNASVSIDGTQQFSATISPTNATEQDVNWTSDNVAVATVNENGLVTGIAEGEAAITATSVDDNTIFDTANIEVLTSQVPVGTIAVNSDRTSIPDNETEQFTALVAPANASNTNVTWASSNVNIATVNASSGLVTAVAAGTASIIATATDGSNVSGSKEITITATQIAVTSITVSRVRPSIPDNQTEQFDAVIAPTNASNQNLTWSSSNTAVATVDQDGLVTAVAAGMAIIEARANDGSNASDSAGITVTASSVQITSITVTRDRSSIPDNETEQFDAVIAPTNASNQNLTWSSSNTAVAAVDQNGLVTAVAAGMATIEARANDGSSISGTAGITVTAATILVTGITVTSTRAGIGQGETENFMAQIVPANASNSTVVWSSSNDAVATVSSTGVVTGQSGGMANIIATATDGSGISGSKGITVLAPTNQAPTANAGLNRTITLPTNSVSLSGTGNDTDGSIVSYQWEQVPTAPTPSANIVSPNSAQTEVTGLRSGRYEFRLTVTDDDMATGTDTVIINVNPGNSVVFSDANSYTGDSTDPTSNDDFSASGTVTISGAPATFRITASLLISSSPGGPPSLDHIITTNFTIDGTDYEVMRASPGSEEEITPAFAPGTYTYTLRVRRASSTSEDMGWQGSVIGNQ